MKNNFNRVASATLSLEDEMRNILAFIVLASFWSLIVIFTNTSISLPIVYWSVSKDECVEVIGDENYDCSNLPKKYERIWVK